MPLQFGSGARHDDTAARRCGQPCPDLYRGEGRKEKAKSKIMQTAVDNDSKWELIMAESTKGPVA